MHTINLANHFLTQVGRTLPDTILTYQVAADMSIFDKISTIAGAILALGVLILAIGVVLAAWNFGKAVNKAVEFMQAAQVDIAPIIRNLTVVSEEVRDITGKAKQQVDKVEKTVDRANSLVDNALKKTDTQVHRFQSFMGVVQDRIESTFISAASTVRGVQTGIGKMVNSLDEDIEDDHLYDPPKAGNGPKVRTRHERSYE